MGKVAFCGLGLMGSGMAGSLMRAGHALRLWNRSPDRARPLVEMGAALAATPREAAHGVEAAISMVSDDEASRAVWLGEAGMLERLEPGAFVIECSTLSHAFVMELSERATQKGLNYLDCPVTGLPDAAARGDLTLLVGGNEEDLIHANSFLAPLSREIVRFGSIGCGTAYKLIVNLLGAVEIAATAEAMETALRAGLDLEQVAESTWDVKHASCLRKPTRRISPLRPTCDARTRAMASPWHTIWESPRLWAISPSRNSITHPNWASVLRTKVVYSTPCVTGANESLESDLSRLDQRQPRGFSASSAPKEATASPNRAPSSGNRRIRLWPS